MLGIKITIESASFFLLVLVAFVDHKEASVLNGDCFITSSTFLMVCLSPEVFPALGKKTHCLPADLLYVLYPHGLSTDTCTGARPLPPRCSDPRH